MPGLALDILIEFNILSFNYYNQLLIILLLLIEPSLIS